MMRTLLLALLVWDCTAKTCLLDHGYSDTGCASGTGVDMDITGYASGEASTISMGVMNITTTWTCLGNGNATEVEAINAMPPTTKTFVADGACVATTMGMTSSTYTCGDCALAKKVLPDQCYGPELICNLALAKDGLDSLRKCDAAAKAKLATYKSCAKTCANPKTANMCGTTSGAARAGVAPTSLMVVVLAVAMYR